MVRELILTQNQVALIDEEDFERVNQHKWCAHIDKNTWYALRGVWSTIEKRPISVLMHRFILGIKKGEYCDHINHNGLDNRRCNLRIVTNQQNLMNKGKYKSLSSSFKGVDWDKSAKKWNSRISYNGKRLFLGHFINEADAALAYDEAAKKYYGEYAKLNLYQEI